MLAVNAKRISCGRFRELILKSSVQYGIMNRKAVVATVNYVLEELDGWVLEYYQGKLVEYVRVPVVLPYLRISVLGEILCEENPLKKFVLKQLANGWTSFEKDIRQSLAKQYLPLNQLLSHFSKLFGESFQNPSK